MLGNNPPKAIALPSSEFLPEVYAGHEANRDAVLMRTVARQFWLVCYISLIISALSSLPTPLYRPVTVVCWTFVLQ